MSDLKRTPLYEAHVAAGARMVDFGGWEMPVQYTGIQAEHRHTRTAAGLFDVSHMGEIEITGPRAIPALDRLIGNDLTKLADGQALYTCMCTPEGGVVDDLVVYRLSAERVLICCNAANRDKDFAWIKAHIGDDQVSAVDVGDNYAQLALQGPKAAEVLQTLTEVDLSSIDRYWAAEGSVAGVPMIISRTGYTGEDGFELYMAPEAAPGLWKALIEAGDGVVAPVGLGARDTLRLEMKYALYGNDIDESTSPLEAGLGWCTPLGAGDFIGKAALVAQKAEGLKRRLIAFTLPGGPPARHGYPVVDAEGQTIGEVTSGTRSPSLGVNIGMAYVPQGQHRSGTPIRVQIRNRVAEGEVVKPPFLKK
ncbi:MAG: glycine cleavage system aminomethyltransferase GcvT [Bradymonadia bacterium]